MIGTLLIGGDLCGQVRIDRLKLIKNLNSLKVRDKKLIQQGSPCDMDFFDKSIQTIEDAKSKRKVCEKLRFCNTNNVACYRRFGLMLAKYALENDTVDIEEALQVEKRDALENYNADKFLLFKDGAWKIVHDIESVIDEVVEFARVVIDATEKDRKSEEIRKDDSFEGLLKHSTIKEPVTGKGLIDVRKMEKEEGRYGSNAGRGCDTRKGPCSCGAWH
jgi:hypothetical protein